MVNRFVFSTSSLLCNVHEKQVRKKSATTVSMRIDVNAPVCEPFISFPGGTKLW